MKKRQLFCLCATVMCNSAIGSVTLLVSNPDLGSIASNFADENGIAKNNMLYSVLIDTDGNGFSLGQYTNFSLSASGFLSTAIGATDDFYFFNNNRVTNNSSGDTEIGGSAGANGTIRTIANLPISSGVSQVSSGDAYGLIYFSSNSANAGARYGFFTSPTFLLPSDGATVDVSQPFSGVDPIRPANFTVVPEPSSFIYLGSVLMMLGFRRARYGVSVV